MINTKKQLITSELECKWSEPMVNDSLRVKLAQWAIDQYNSDNWIVKLVLEWIKANS